MEMLPESARNPWIRRQRLEETRKREQIIANVIEAQLGKRLAGKKMKEISLGAIALYNGLDMLKILGYSDSEIEDSWSRTMASVVQSEMRALDSRRRG